MDQNALYYALSTIAQVAATLAALIGFLGMWRLDKLRDEAKEVEGMLAELIKLAPLGESITKDPKDYPRDDALVPRGVVFFRARQIVDEPKPGDFLLRVPVGALLKRWDALPKEQQGLIRSLIGLLATTLIILILSTSGFIWAEKLRGWKVTPWLIIVPSVCLGMGPAYVIYQAARSIAPLEPRDFMWLADKPMYDAVQAMRHREQERRSPADNSTAAEADDEA